jgi:hypothetical protein
MKQLFDTIHTESEGPVGFSVAIVFYFCCVAVLFGLITYVILPAVKSVTGHTAAVAFSSMLA